jgi:hypothetical protein
MGVHIFTVIGPHVGNIRFKRQNRDPVVGQNEANSSEVSRGGFRNDLIDGRQCHSDGLHVVIILVVAGFNPQFVVMLLNRNIAESGFIKCIGDAILQWTLYDFCSLTVWMIVDGNKRMAEINRHGNIDCKLFTALPA